MKIGLIARADNSGLGVQTKGFYDHMPVAKTLVVDISKMNGNKIFPERYPNAQFVRGIPTPNQFREFLADLDVVFIAESAYSFEFYEIAKELGVKTAVQYNYEFFDWAVNPNYPTPDMFIAPSKWHYQDVEDICKQRGIMHAYLHCPIDRTALPFREIKQARTFLHVAGRAAAHDRNGTFTLIEASRFLKTEANIRIHFQGEQGLKHQLTATTEDYHRNLRNVGNPNSVTITTEDYDDYADVYKEGDVLVLPRRYGGNCLPLNEGLSIGMPVIMTDIAPNNEFLPQNWLVASGMVGTFTPRTRIDIFGADPQALAAKIDRFYNYSADLMRLENQVADRLAQHISWDGMRAQYMKAFEELCTH